MALYLADDGSVELFEGTAENGYYFFETEHLSTYALAEASAAKTYAKQQSTLQGVQKTSVKLTAKKNAPGIRLAWTKAKGYKVDGYQVYRAASKNGSYGRILTTKTGSKLQTINAKNLKKGKTYYYKVRGYRIVNGKKYYTKWSQVSARRA